MRAFQNDTYRRHWPRRTQDIGHCVIFSACVGFVWFKKVSTIVVSGAALQILLPSLVPYGNMPILSACRKAWYSKCKLSEMEGTVLS